MGSRAPGRVGRTVAALACAAALLAAAQAGAVADCAPERLDLRGPWGQARFRVEVADDPAERARGLMNRPEMAAGAGMLFVYERPQAVSFWMKNTLIPLDMIFADAGGRVVRIHENAVPLDTTPIFGGDSVQYVLEINGGTARALGISPGSEIRHPAIPPERAAWPCAED